MNRRRAWSLLLCILLICAGCAAAENTETTTKEITSLDDLAGANIGVQTGMICDRLSQERIPGVQIKYYNSQTDALIALQTGKVAGWCCDEPVARYMSLSNPGMIILKEHLAASDLAAVFPKTDKGKELRDQYSHFVDGLWADGTMKEIDAVWFSTDEDKRTVIDYTALPDINGTLHMATDATIPPFSFVKDGRVVGYDIDVAARFCQANGYRLEIEQMSFDSILAAVQTGKCDFAASCITITDERAESVLFSSPDYRGGVVMTVLSPQGMAAAAREDSGSEGIVSSFEKTFIREGRWQLFADGILTTLLITVLSILFGTLAGFLAFMMCRNGNAIANGATRFSMWLVQGMPMVVLLMVLYYIVFGSVSINGIAVAVIGFTLTFGSAVFGLLKMGIGTIDRGQYEASYALGYPNRRTFFRIILPQAVPNILPAYKSEIVGLIKATAIVGYIAVQDLTKMGDIVRSRTYEAFFPLIAVTVFYFLMEGLLAFIIRKALVRINPKKRRTETILKGIRPDDGTSINETDTPAVRPHPSGQREAPIIRIEHLTKVYPNITPLKDVSAEVRDGDVISVIGPSGTGKSTLLRCINLLETPTEGHVWVNGTEVTAPGCDLGRVRQKMGMVFQSFNLFSHLTVIENIMLAPMDLLKKKKQDAYDEGMRLLRMVGLAEKALNYPDELSGGQKQRIAIARTLAMDPDIILLDEPTSALDPTMVGEVQAVIRELAKMGKTLMIVTHEMNFARAISNRVFFMDESGIYEEGTPEQIFDNPQKENTRRFIRKLKVLELRIENRDYDFLAMAGEIEKYSRKNQIPWKTAQHLRLAFEELVQQTLVPALQPPLVYVTVEYSAVDESAVMTIRYNGREYDVTAREDNLSRKVLESAASEAVYTRIDDAACPNQVTLKIRA